MSDHVTQIHSYIPHQLNRDILRNLTKKKKKKKKNGCQSETNIQTSKMEVLVRALLERNTGSWHPRGRELSYGTEAQVWGIGEFLIYKIDVWQILILMRPSHFDISDDSMSSTKNSQLIK